MLDVTQTAGRGIQAVTRMDGELKWITCHVYIT